MAITASELGDIKRKVENAKVEYDRAVGRLQAVESQMKSEGFATFDDLVNEISRLAAEREKLKAYFEQEVATYKVEYAELLK
jgi:uncharacterized membrane-anchored protein